MIVGEEGKAKYSSGESVCCGELGAVSKLSSLLASELPLGRGSEAIDLSVE